MQLHYFPTPAATNTLSTEQLRETFLLGGLFQPGAVNAHYTDLDRMIVGAAVPTTAPLGLPNDKEIGTSFFLERREIGILNVGAGPGIVRVGGVAHPLATLDCLYIGLGEKDVTFENGTAGQAQFYFISTPAHAKHPTVLARRADVTGLAHRGTNTLEVRVTNLWVNRLIGDAQPGARPITFTTLKTYRADAPLRPSGLLGPVTLNVER